MSAENSQTIREVLYYENFDLDNIVTPVNVNELNKYLKETNYDEKETEFLVKGFSEGFDLGFRGPENIKQTSQNLKFTIGDKIELWNKVMKEVKELRYAGPFEEIPFDNYIQSPIGLVPKDGGKKTRLIFHLSYPRDQEKGVSINSSTPREMCTVKYKEFDQAVRLCIQEGRNCYMGKSDMTSAFRHLAMNKKFWKYLVMKAQNPTNNKWYYFVDKCMPFGASISCSHFQRFSNAISHIVQHYTKKENINYLDDFFFVHLLRLMCNHQIDKFLQVCKKINFPVSMEKTFWGTTKLSFLGLLIDTINQLVCVPVDKITKASRLISAILNKKNKKMEVQQLQQLTGFLNFLGKAVPPGRAFTRRLYCIEERAIEKKMKKHHHIPVTAEMKMDLQLWQTFLHHPTIYSRQFLDMDKTIDSVDVDFYTDASANPELGCGGICGEDWFITQWNEKFIKKYHPSINYLELYALTVAIFNWIHKFKNQRIYIFCDNMSVVQMVNKTSSKCKNCMVLIRFITLQALTHNVKINVKHVPGKSNNFSDWLSRLEYQKFRQHARKTKRHFKGKPCEIPEDLWPMEKIWLTSNYKSANTISDSRSKKQNKKKERRKSLQ